MVPMYHICEDWQRLTFALNQTIITANTSAPGPMDKARFLTGNRLCTIHYLVPTSTHWD
jgi:hypothetical protein